MKVVWFFAYWLMGVIVVFALATIIRVVLI
jgi:hypothetical protein